MSALRNPNFFLIGGPKCGTTSLARYLADHPRIFFSDPKEPHFFSSDFREPTQITSERRYLKLFKKATSEHIAVGEGSVFYLYSSVAVQNILRFNRSAKFITMVRSPVEMVQSLHSENLLGCTENVTDFEQAWQLQRWRKTGKLVPRFCFEPQNLFYSDMCSLGAQHSRLFSQVPRDRVFVIVLDDLRVNPKKIYEEVLVFLGLPSDGRAIFPVYNQNKVLRYRTVSRVLAFLGNTKQSLGIKASLGLGRALAPLNTIASKRPPLRNEFRMELCRHFRPDVETLSSLLDRDLTRWVTM